MSTTYSPAPDVVALMVNQRLAKAHPELHRVGVRVGVLMAWNPDGVALKHHGNAANATIQVVKHKDRVTKGYDAEMCIDQTRWDDFRPRQRAALIAHELKHLELVQKADPETGEIKPVYDDGGRPKLKTRPGDWDAGDGFAEIVAEFGNDAVEFHNIKSCWMLAEQAREIGEAQAEEAALRTLGEDEADEEGEDEEEDDPHIITIPPRMAERFAERVKNETISRPGSGVTAVADGEQTEDGEADDLAEYRDHGGEG